VRRNTSHPTTGDLRLPRNKESIMKAKVVRATLLVACSALLGATLAASPPAEAAGVTASNITSPTDGTHWFFTDAHPATTVTVTGTSTGTTGDSVDIRCYANTYSWTSGASNVPVAADGSFSTAMDMTAVYGTCILRAVPAGLAAGSDMQTFTGPRMTAESSVSTKITSGGPNYGKVVSYYVEFQSAHAMNDYGSTTDGGLWDSRLSNADGTSSNYLWYGNAILAGNEGTRSYMQVDGHNSFGPYTAAYGTFAGAANSQGLPSLTYSATRNATTGDTTIHETDPIVRCPSDTFPPTAASCPDFVSAGVRLERTLFTTDGGRQVHIGDVWRSTDGKAHTISAHYYQAVQGANAALPGTATPVGVRLPWLGGYQTFTSDTTYPGTSSVPNTVFVRDDNTAPDGNLDYPRGAISFDLGPSNIHRASNRSFVQRDEGIKVPAGGMRLVRQYFVMGTTDAEVAAKAAANRTAINPYRPDGLIKKAGTTSFVGNHVYNTTGTHQTATAERARTKTATFYVKVQNDGTAADSFRLKGPGSTSGFSVKYYAGTTSITGTVVNGTYQLSLAPGNERTIRLVVMVGSGARIAAVRSWLVTATSTHDGARKDSVKAVVNVT
jgi:hypothetical protein